MLRDTMVLHAGGWSISEPILSMGQATANTLPARLAELHYMMQVPSVEMVEMAETIGQHTGCHVERTQMYKSRPSLANHAMASMVWKQLQQVDPPVWGEEAKALIRKV